MSSAPSHTSILHCGHRWTDGETCCPLCGDPILPQYPLVFVCPSCKDITNPRYPHCGKCGKRILKMKGGKASLGDGTQTADALIQPLLPELMEAIVSGFQAKHTNVCWDIPQSFLDHNPHPHDLIDAIWVRMRKYREKTGQFAPQQCDGNVSCYRYLQFWLV